MSDTILQTIQDDAMGVLKNTPGLALAQVLSADEGLTEADVMQKLATLTGVEKNGLAIIVMQPEVPRAERNLPGPRVRVEQSIQVIEQVVLNRAATGTQIRANVAAMRVLAALHQQVIGNTILYADQKPCEPLPGKKGFVTYLVTVYAEQLNVATVERVQQLAFGIDGNSDLVIETATPGAAIYFTTDGSFPGPSNDAATLYAGPVTIADGDFIRAAAYLSPLNPSSISNVTIRIDGEITLNGELVTMGGETIFL
jgi:hypothetical protein